MALEYEGLRIDWPGYSTIRIENQDSTVVYLDPGRVDYGVLTDSRPTDADYVLITHSHHYDPEAIHRVSTPETDVYVLDDVVELNNLANRKRSEVIPPDVLPYDVHVFEYKEEFSIGEIPVTTVPAYNKATPDGLAIRLDGDGFQPPGTAVGFHLTIDGTRLFWPGDSDFLDHHRDLDVDVLLPPISQVVTMNRLEAVELAKVLDPELVIPVHYRWKDKTPDGKFFHNADPRPFKQDIENEGIRCEII